MYSINSSRKDMKILVEQLKHQGMEENMIFGFIMTLKSFYLKNPDMNHLQINEYLPLRGWNDFELDYDTFQIALACIHTDNGKSVHLSGLS